MNVTILFGGKTGEHEVSLVSASSVAKHINDKKHNINLVAITKDGLWYLQDKTELARLKAEPKASLEAKTTENQVIVVPGKGKNGGLSLVNNGKVIALPTDVVFPVLHGTYGEDGLVQGLLEMAELPYCGCDVMSSALSMDKEKTKQIWQNAGLPIVPFITVKNTDRNDAATFENIIKKSERDFEWPVFIKPCKAGSSVGASKACNREEFIKAIDEALLWDNKILVEPFINAREIECSVTGYNEISVYTPGEIVPSHEFYDYEAKYIDPDGAALKIPADLDDETIRNVREIAVKAFKALDGCGCSRIDFFLDKNDGKFYLNEINTMPGFTNISMFPKLCEASGLPYPDMLEKLLALGIERFNATRALKTSI